MKKLLTPLVVALVNCLFVGAVRSEGLTTHFCNWPSHAVMPEVCRRYCYNCLDLGESDIAPPEEDTVVSDRDFASQGRGLNCALEQGLSEASITQCPERCWSVLSETQSPISMITVPSIVIRVCLGMFEADSAIDDLDCQLVTGPCMNAWLDMYYNRKRGGCSDASWNQYVSNCDANGQPLSPEELANQCTAAELAQCKKDFPYGGCPKWRGEFAINPVCVQRCVDRYRDADCVRAEKKISVAIPEL